MGVPLYVICHFSLVAFNILSLSLIFVSLINMCLGVLPFEFYSAWDSLCFLGLVDYFLSHGAACLGLVHGDDPERCCGEGGGRGVHVCERK